MNAEQSGESHRRFEFVALMALLTSLVALSIDAMLPALPEIGADLGVIEANDNQWIISALFIGLAVGQMIYGPLSDSTGRKPAIYAGLVFFIIGCLLSLFASTYTMMLAGRFLQGLGAAGPRIVTIALVRDRFQGREMARIMSFVMMVFILVPAIAPALGQMLLLIAHWRMIFAVFLLLAVIVFVWFALRQEETLTQERRAAFSWRRIGLAIRETFTHRIAFGYTMTAGFIFGAFVGFLNSVQQIFQQQYELGVLFPAYFAVLALSIGGASFINAKLVMRYGMRTLFRNALRLLCGLSLPFIFFAYFSAGHPPLPLLMLYLMCSFCCFGILFGNANALAMEPLGHIAGTAAAVIASLTTVISLTLGAMIGQAYNGTVMPLVIGFCVLGLTALAMMSWTERGAKPEV